jgi:hypothetical protein
MFDRPILQLTAPREGVEPEREEVDPQTQWTDTRYMIRRTVEMVRTVWFGGEALPWCWNPISAGWALLFGCQPHYLRDTVFIDPAPAGRDGLPELDRWAESPWRAMIRDAHAAFARSSQGRFFVPVFWGNSAMDTLGVVRGPEALLTDIALNPSWVAEANRRMTAILRELFDELWPLVGPAVTGLEGSVETCGFWSPGRARTFDADLAFGISAESFRQLVLPPLVDWMAEMDHASWHLDGVGNLTHLPTLLGLPELDAIQWVQGDGTHAAIAPWFDLLRRIQDAGKSVQVICKSHEVLPLLKGVRPEGLAINTACASEKDGRELLETVRRMYQ